MKLLMVKVLVGELEGKINFKHLEVDGGQHYISGVRIQCQ